MRNINFSRCEVLNARNAKQYSFSRCEVEKRENAKRENSNAKISRSGNFMKFTTRKLFSRFRVFAFLRRELHVSKFYS